MSELVSRAHMRQQPVVQPSVERIQVKQPTPENVIGTQDIAWESYYDLNGHFIQQWQTGALPTVPEPTLDTSKTTAIIAGKEVKRQPYIDDFADMMRREDADNHMRLERYINPLGPNGGLNWFAATMLAVMIENGRIGIKETALGNRAVYMHRARTGNPLFRIFGGRLTLLLAIAQWYLLGGIAWIVSSVDFSGQYSDYDQKKYALILAAICFAGCFLYNLAHWRFHKKYAFVLSKTLIDGWKARSAPTTFDTRWGIGRMAVHAVNLSLFTTSVIVLVLLLIKHIGWL